MASLPPPNQIGESPACGLIATDYRLRATGLEARTHQYPVPRSWRQSAAIAGRLADLVIAVEPKRELLEYFADAGGSGKPSYGQLPVSFDPDEGAARRRAHQQFRWFSGGWKVNAELPGTAAFAGASRMVTEDDVASQIPCGSDVDRHLDGIRQFAEAGFSHLALVQVGGDHQTDFIKWAGEELLSKARQL